VSDVNAAAGNATDTCFTIEIKGRELKLKAKFESSFFILMFQANSSRRFQHGFHGFKLHRPTETPREGVPSSMVIATPATTCVAFVLRTV